VTSGWIDATTRALPPVAASTAAAANRPESPAASRIRFFILPLLDRSLPLGELRPRSMAAAQQACGGEPNSADRFVWVTELASWHDGAARESILAFEFALLVRHDDPERKFAYDAGAERALAEAAKHGWTVASMKDDFSTVFAVEPM
jgi:hypothetical protein